MILVTGATGNNGGKIIAALLALGRTDVRALVRDPVKDTAKVAAWRNAGVEVAIGDLADPESLDEPMRGVERVLVLSPVNPNQVTLQHNAFEAAKRAGVAHVVKFSMIGADPASDVPLSRWHGESELELEGSGLAWTHVRPNDLMGANVGLLMDSTLRKGVFRHSLGDARLSMVAEQDVAEVVARTLTDDRHAGRTYVLTGPEALSFYDVADELASALGRPVRYEPVDPETEQAAMRAGGLAEPAIALVSALRAYEREGHNAVLTPDVADILGRPPTPFATIAAELADAHRGAA